AYQVALVVLLFLKRARNPDSVFLSVLAEFHRRLQRRNVVLILCGVQADLAKALKNTRLNARIGERNIIPESGSPGDSVHEAICRAYDVLGSDFCQICPRRKETAKEQIKPEAATVSGP